MGEQEQRGDAQVVTDLNTYLPICAPPRHTERAYRTAPSKRLPARQIGTYVVV